MSSRKPDRSGHATTEGVTTEGEESFYARWSRRKRRARANDLEPPSSAPVSATTRSQSPSSSPEAEPAKADAPPALTDADMPPIESLDGSSDVSGFMSPGVSEELRNKALRKMFLSSQFNVVDGLDDYDDDFTAFEALGDLVTSDMRHQRELAEQRAREMAERAERSTPSDATRELEAQADVESADEDGEDDEQTPPREMTAEREDEDSDGGDGGHERS